MTSIGTPAKEPSNMLDAEDAASRKLSVVPETTASPAATSAQLGETASKGKLEDITNLASQRRTVRSSPEKNRKDPFANFRLRVQQQQLQHQERLRERQQRRKQIQENLQNRSQENSKIVSEVSSRVAVDVQSARDEPNGKEIDDKPDIGADEKDSSMPPPNHEMTKLVLRQRKNRVNQYRHPQTSDSIKVQTNNCVQRENINRDAGKTTETALEIEEKSTLTSVAKLNNSTPPYDPNGYHYTTLADGTPVYTSLPFQSPPNEDLKKDSTGAENKQACEDAVVPTKDDTTEPMRESRNSNRTRFKDIIGHQSVKLRLDEVLLPLALPENLSRTILTGIRSLPTSILMFGPPGCGKTQLAKAVAGEANAAFLSIGPSDILSKYVGESEAAVRSVFAEAIRLARNNREGNKSTVLFFDEIDALGISRGGRGEPKHSGGYSGGDNSSRRVLAELLIQLTKVNDAHGTFDYTLPNQDDIEHDKDKTGNGLVDLKAMAREEKCGDSISSDDTLIYHDDSMLDEKDEPIQKDCESGRVRIIVIAATNRPEDCDAALIRRFGVQVQVGLPTARDRRKMLKLSMKDIHHTITNKQFSDLSLVTDGWSGSDVNNLAREAAMAPVRECIRTAALLKRRQYLSVSSGRKKRKTEPKKHDKFDNNHEPGSTVPSRVDVSSTESQKKLLEEFGNLRPVSFRDYQKALAFWFGRMFRDLRESPLAAFGWVDDCEEVCGTSDHAEHYDSSSDEEDEDE